MLTVIQRVTEASVRIDEKVVGEIEGGLLILCGFALEDNSDTLSKMLTKCLQYRIFSDNEGKMNLSLKKIEGGLLLVPQFTLMADTSRGLRPGFSRAAPPEQGKRLFAELIELAKAMHPVVEYGVFGADMKVGLCNDGPVTFVMEF
ncbi:D-tyrosyl-tRNA(Tyr) deacylase [Legionella israelensis]|uniref:D-aminoacyl-tRNA deacylase n=1 Tax=Legionella israelensis TaxID=454 RepID=UPI00117C0059|nr:D-aminoacyl-tRNA deacylase [Legionella israelensis]QDP72562.1 D-tyrosyl-tRNA(Tyr) deacylase [Legionella israelensis]